MNIVRELSKTKQASRALPFVDEKKVNLVLKALGRAIVQQSDEIVTANAIDCARLGKAHPTYDRLLLTEERLKSMTEDIKKITTLSAGLSEVLEQRTMPNGLRIEKIRVPLGVVGVIYEARPNVTTDVFSICFKSRNGCILKPGSDMKHSAVALVGIIHDVLKDHGLDPAVILLLPPTRAAARALLNAREYVDVIIPRGGKRLIDFVVDHARVPVIETGAGIVHTYVDRMADLQKAAAIIFNAKTRRPSVCNALDTLIVHQEQLKNLPLLVDKLAEKQVKIFADNAAYAVLNGIYPLLSRATQKHFGMEFLSLQMSIKTVASVEAAVEHIQTHGSKHSEAILSNDPTAIQYFTTHVDAAAVYVNASTAFTDGGEFGLGAEIGISTQKLHARGPMALKEMTTSKWLITGNGQVRELTPS